MKISYNIKGKNSFKVFNDSMGLALNRENIIRSKKVKYLSYLTTSLLEIFISSVFLILMIILCKSFYCALSVFLVYFATMLFLFMIISIIYPLLFANFFAHKDEYELVIDERGVSFYFEDDECITLGWTHIRALVIGKYSVNFITDDSYYFYLDRKYRGDVVKALKQYNESLLIIK